MKVSKRIMVILMIAVMVVSLCIPSSAATTQWCNKCGSGYKNYNGSQLVTGWSGKLKAKKTNIFSDDSCIFTGNSYSRWQGLNPYNADMVIHYDILEVKGIGSVDFSGGLGADRSGPSASMGIGGTTSSKTYAYAYEVTDAWRVEVDYSYYAEIYSASWMDLFTAASFRFGTSFKVVNSRVDNSTVYSGTIYYN